MRHSVASIVVGIVALGCAAECAAGKYSQGQRKRGDVTGLSPKVDGWAFIDDTALPPRRLLLVVDTWPARGHRYPGVLPLGVAVAYEGAGEPLDACASKFRLAWEEEERRADVTALLDAPELDGDAIDEGLRRDHHRLRARTPLDFTPAARRAELRLRSPRREARRYPECDRLAPGTWFESLLWFPVPPGTDLWERRFELTLLGDADLPLARVAFRIERQSYWQQGTFRRARHAIRRENRSGGHASFAR